MDRSTAYAGRFGLLMIGLGVVWCVLGVLRIIAATAPGGTVTDWLLGFGSALIGLAIAISAAILRQQQRRVRGRER